MEEQTKEYQKFYIEDIEEMEISVIITNYNYDKFLARCIRSLVTQSYDKKEYEIIIIDDCSTDNSKDIILNYESVGLIRTVLNEKNIGLAACCNIAIKSALGKYVIRVDADDYVSADFLKVHQLFLSNNKTDMNATSSDYYEVDLYENTLCRKNGTTWPIACGTMFKTDDLIELGIYNESLPREDVDLRKRFLKSGRHIYNIPIPLYRYTQHKNSMTKDM